MEKRYTEIGVAEVHLYWDAEKNRPVEIRHFAGKTETGIHRDNGMIELIDIDLNPEENYEL